MAATLEIPMSIKDFTKCLSQLKQIQAQINSIGKAANANLNFSVSPNGGSTRRGAGGGSGGSGGGGGGQQQRRPRTPPNFTSRLNTFVRSTRFGAGGVSPLIGRGLDLVAPELGALAGPVGLFAVGLTKAAQGLKDFVLSTNNAANNFQGLRYGTGGTPQQTGQLTALANSLGMDPSALAGIAGNLANAAASGGLPGMAAANLGLQQGPAGLYNVDQSKNLRTAIDKLKAMSPGQAQQMATLAGATDLLRFRDRSGSDLDKIFAAGSGLGNASGGALASQEKLSTALGNLKTSVDTLTTTLGGKVAGPASSAVNYLADIGPGGRLHGKPAQQTSILSAILLGNGATGSAAPSAAPEQHPVVKAINRLATVTEKNTQATQQNTLTGMPGMYGNASRGDAYGGGMGGLALQRMIAQKQALQLSPF